MVEFICFLVAIAGCVFGIRLGCVSKVKGPKGKRVKDEKTVNWLKEIDGPDEPLTDKDFKRLKRSYNKMLTYRPIYAALFFVVTVIMLLVGFFAEFEMIFVFLEIFALAVSLIIILVNAIKNRNILDRERNNFTKKMAIVIDSNVTTYVNAPRVAMYTGNATGQVYSMRIGVCNSDGSPRIYTIPILSDLYSLVPKIDKLEVILYKGKFSTILAFKTEEEIKEEDENFEYI